MCALVLWRKHEWVFVVPGSVRWEATRADDVDNTLSERGTRAQLHSCTRFRYCTVDIQGEEYADATVQLWVRGEERFVATLDRSKLTADDGHHGAFTSPSCVRHSRRLGWHKLLAWVRLRRARLLVNSRFGLSGRARRRNATRTSKTKERRDEEGIPLGFRLHHALASTPSKREVAPYGQTPSRTPSQLSPVAASTASA